MHRRIAVLSILIALLAGSLDAMMWREARHAAAQAQIDAELEAEVADIQREFDLLSVELDAQSLEILRAELAAEAARLDALREQLRRDGIAVELEVE